MKKKGVKIVVGYPPIVSKKGVPLLSQNRQFQYFNTPTYIYPMVPAYAATNLQKHGYKTYWMDGIAEQKTYDEWIDDLKKINPDYLMVETKSPVVKTHWKYINDLKKRLPNLKLIWVGDHVTYLPLELFEHSKVDYAITGGDYDFVVVNLLNHIYKGEALEGGVYWRKGDTNIKAKPVQTDTINIVTGGAGGRAPDDAERSEHRREGNPRQNLSLVIHSSGPASLKHDLNSLPFIDRDLTRWKLYAYENGNYKYTPGTYMYSGRDCWWNRCTFCVWDHTINPLGSYRSFTPERLFEEVKHIVDNYGVKEIFDDAGTMFAGAKLQKFCELLINSGYNKKVRYGCNMRFNAIKTQELYNLMGKAGFRFILYGMESANQKTLDRLDKGTKEEDAIIGPMMAKKAGLDPHVTIMLGYPWESYKDARRTTEVAKYAFKKGYYETMQATIVIPYPGTPLYRECKEKGLLLTDDYERFDMREPVMKTPITKETLLELEQDLYSAFMTPQYAIRKILGIRSFHDFKYLFYMAWKLLGHLLDFDPKQTKVSFFSLSFWKNASSKLGKHFFSPKTSVDAEKDAIRFVDSAVNL